MPDLRLYLKQSPRTIADDNGIGRVVHAQYRMLPALGIELVDDPDAADVTATHIEGTEHPYDVLHCHGLYWHDMPHAPYQAWHHEANRRIAATARQARAITVPSPWVGEIFRRDMRIDPDVIGHGVDLAEWPTSDRHDGYVLWNKNRAGDVCDPTPAYELARRGLKVVTTFAPPGLSHPNLLEIGTKPHHEMREIVRRAGLYLATTCETFGIGTLEAMAAGVPVVGYRWGGTADLVQSGFDGLLVEPGDIDGLATMARSLLAQRDTWQRSPRVEQHTWDAVMRRYAALYRRIAEQKTSERHRVCVVVTSYNYGAYLRDAVNSVLPQLQPGDEVRIVNDGSTDDTHAIANAIEVEHYHQDRITVRHHVQSNQGVAAARNNGIRATDCEYIICLDADDQLGPEYIRVCRDALKADWGLGIAYTGLGLISEGGITPVGFPPAFDWAHQAKPGNPPNTCVPTAAMFRRTLWERAGGYVQAHAPGEDAEFYTRGLSIGYTARKVVNDPLIWYRNHSGGASKTKPYKAIDHAHPWMHDGRYPFAAPTTGKPTVLSYHQPLVSVIIPVGPGHGRYLPAALNSLLAQTCRQWEVIVCNDSGEDLPLTPYPFVRSVKPFDGYATMGSRGPAAARNAALKLARAPLVLFLDADDWLCTPDALAAMLAAHAQTGGAYIYTDGIYWEGGKAEERKASDYHQAAILDPVQPWHAITALIPREWVEAVKGFDETIGGWEDRDFFMKLAAAGHCGHRLPRPLLAYRRDSGNERNKSLSRRAELVNLLARRYEGITAMGCGCSGNAAALKRIREEVLTLGGIGIEDASAAAGIEVPPGYVLMEYYGTRQGEETIRSRTNRTVRYTYSAGGRFYAALEGDVDWLSSMGSHRRAGTGAPVVASTPDPVFTHTPPPAIAALRDVRQPIAPPPADPVAPDGATIDAAMRELIQQGEQMVAEKAAQAAETLKRRRGRPAKGEA